MKSLRAGFAQADITPALAGIWLDGYGMRTRPAESVRDPLYAKVCVLDDGSGIHLIASLDLCGLSQYFDCLLRDIASAVCGIPAARMTLCCIHSHSAPAGGMLPRFPVNRDWLAHAGELLGQAALRAMARAVPCTADFRILDEPLTHTRNRRGQPERDPRIRTAAFRDESGTLRGVLCQASCHAVINTDYRVSADYLSVLNARSADECPYLFLQSRGADINPSCMTPVEEGIRTLGHDLADPVAAAAADARAGIPLTGPLESIREYVTVPMRFPGTPEEMAAMLREAEAVYLTTPPEDTAKYGWQEKMIWLRLLRDMRESGKAPEVRVPLQILRSPGVFVFAFLPFEVLTATGDRLEAIFRQAGYPAERIWITGYANSVNGYLAPPEALSGDHYEAYEAYESAFGYNLPNTSPASEPAVLAWFASHA